MGQIESTSVTQNDALVLSKEKEEKENKGDNPAGRPSGSSNGTENKEMMNCVKNRIDMLIEGCLLSKESTDLWVPESKLKKTSCDIYVKDDVNSGSENPKDADNGADLVVDGDQTLVTGDNVDGDVTKVKSEVSDNKVNEGQEAIQKTVKQETVDKVNETVTSEQNILDEKMVKSIETVVKEESNIVIEEEKVDTKVGNGKKELKVSDLLSEMSQNDKLTDLNKKKLTTFQAFIDQVLDNSLQHVNATMKVEKTTNILELCSKSMAPTDKQTNVSENSVKSESHSESEMASNNVNTTQTLKTQPVEAEKDKNVKSERHMISLKDHIERFLELSFQEKKSDDESPPVSKVNSQSKEGATGSHNKSGNSDNFNAQGLVNNMINQGLQINKLLSPTSSKSKEMQVSPNGRLEPGEVHRRDYQQKPWPTDERMVGHNLKYSESDRAGIGRQYPVGHKYNGGQQRSPNGTNPGFHEMEQRGGYLPHSKLDYPEYKNRMYGSDDRVEHNREEHMLQDRYPGYPVHKLQKPIPHMLAAHPPDQVLHPAMMYPSQFSPRHSQLPSTDTPKDHGLVIHHESLNNRSHKQGIHLRDCKCAMCVPHPDLRYQASEHKSAEYHSAKLALSPSAFPQYSPSHTMNPSYMSIHRLQSQPDQPPAMMRPSHSAVPPGYLGYQQMPKLLPHHPPITSPKEYSQIQLNVPSNVHVSKNINPTGRLSVEDSYSAEMFPYRQPRHDPAAAMYQKRMKEHEMSQGKYSGYPVMNQRRPSSVTREDQRKEVHDILQSPESRVLGADWSRRRDCPSNSSSVSGDTPLDLSFKKSDQDKPRRSGYSNLRASPEGYQQLEPQRPRTQSFIEDPHMTSEGLRLEPQRSRAQTLGNASQVSSANLQRKGNSLYNTFIKHLESSVDKYCQELKASPPAGIPASSPTPPSNKSGSPNELASSGYHGQSPSSSRAQAPSTYGTLSAPYAGGITLGQPILGPEARTQHMENRQSPKQQAMPVTSSMLTQAQPSVVQPQPVSTAASLNYDSMDQRTKRNNISKHEPIQNIIGNHDPNDILYLICRLCAQTYGSPYGFRKHFRNQHSFEPRSEHTIVQTISATKTALGGPNMPGQKVPGVDERAPNLGGINVSQEHTEGSEVNTHVINESPATMKSSSSHDSNSVCSEEGQEAENLKSVQNSSEETKYLECPECGKTFQLNDFGSYKRHCRQHGQVKTGTLSCTKCHLSFADQQLLKEHYNVHVKETSPQSKNDKPVLKSETAGKVYPCVPCDKTFDDILSYEDHFKTKHGKINDQPPKLSPQINLGGSGTYSSASKDESSEHKWPDISLSVIPSHNVVKQAAESMTAIACPDSSSWNDDSKELTSTNDKMEDSSQNYDSASLGSNDEKGNDNAEKVDENLLRQKSVDSSYDNADDKSSTDGCEFLYKHKKFHSHRKRALSNCSQSSDSAPAKQAKLSPPVLSRSNTPVTSYSVQVTNESADSTCSVDSKAEDSPNVKDCSSTPSPCEDMKIVALDGNPKQEARHHLPFVWDRVTRSQVGRKTK